ncbi:SMI1/KNR4 family protein [Candidatus Albibeggiatoa sp. nov. NOAA]|uniref:SMI1/KNR4 family protein n=1 Tax=Candidatus Albibeggiatoa sp. nov. NOAA TaxID=3162724 RepID=UPI0033041009|nr:SMI1/KNR4 family protein [Thiotrichaceae bacterium]
MTSTLHDYWHDYIERCKQIGGEHSCQTATGATPEEIRAIELKYGVTLPNSYRALLEVTNGLTLMNTDCLDFYPDEHLFYPINEIGLFNQRCDPEELWQDQIEENYPYPEADYQFFYDRNLQVIDSLGNIAPSKMQDKRALFRYKDSYDLIQFGHYRYPMTWYCFNPNSEPQKGESEIWLFSIDDALAWSDFCLKFLNFIEFAEYLLHYSILADEEESDE